MKAHVMYTHEREGGIDRTHDESTHMRAHLLRVPRNLAKRCTYLPRNHNFKVQKKLRLPLFSPHCCAGFLLFILHPPSSRHSVSRPSLHHSSRTTHHSPLLSELTSHHSSHTTRLTPHTDSSPLLSHRSSHSHHLVPHHCFSHHSSHTTYTSLILHHSSHTILHTSLTHTTHRQVRHQHFRKTGRSGVSLPGES